MTTVRTLGIAAVTSGALLVAVMSGTSQASTVTESRDGAHRSFEEVHSDGEHNGQILDDHDHGEREYSEMDIEALFTDWDKWDFKTFPKNANGVKLGEQVQLRLYKSSAENPVVVDWGDGTVEAYEQTKKICKTPKQARKNTKRCVIKVKHQYQDVGTYTIQVTNPSSKAEVISGGVNVIPSGVNSDSGSIDNSVGVGGWWTPEPGSNSQRVWQAERLGATFAPCTTVQWYFDRSNEPNAALYKQTPEALDVIAKHSGLTFVETQDPNAAMLTFEWEEFTDGWSSAAGVGGQRRDFRYDPSINTSVETRTGAVRFNLLDPWATSKNTTGFNPARVGNTTYTGSGWLIVHEAMHALGVDHSLVNGDVMSPIIDWDVDAMSSNDIDALNVMYLNNPCPAA